MHVILAPGMWLDASAWDAVVPVLHAAGHEVEPISLPGQDPAADGPDLDRATISFEDHVQAVVDRIDAASRESSGSIEIALVGHSASGAVVSVAADRRASRIAAAVYVDAFPFPEGDYDNDEFPAVDGEIPLPEWDAFPDAMLTEMTEAQRTALRARAVPVPASLARTSFRYSDPARHAIPTTVITSEMTPDELTGAVTEHAPWASELVATEDLRIVGLDTGHWAMFTRPEELGGLIVEALRAG